jgi:hypothetical protein
LNTRELQRWICLKYCNGLNICVLPKFICSNPNLPNLMILGVKAFGRLRIHNGGAMWVYSRISGLIKGIHRVFFFFCHVRMQWEESTLQLGRGLLPGPDNAGTLLSDATTVRNKFLLYISHPVYVTLLWQLEVRLRIYIFMHVLKHIFMETITLMCQKSQRKKS